MKNMTIRDNAKTLYFRQILKRFTGVFLLAFLVLNTVKVQAANIRVNGKMMSQTSCRIKLKKYKDITHWKVRMAAMSEDGNQEPYSTVKKMKVSKKAYTLTDLKPDTYYFFEIIGCVKQDGKLKNVIYDYYYCYTGLSSVGWTDYAASDAPCSPEGITLWYGCWDDGLPISGFELYRREEEASDWILLATTSPDETVYEDKEIEARKTYYYRVRAYGTYNGETIYSEYSDEMRRSAVNMEGSYSSTLIKKTGSTVIVKIDSENNNGELSLNSRYSLGIAEDMEIFEDYEEIPLKIAAVSADGENWEKLSKGDSAIIKGGESLYLRLKPLRAGVDISAGNIIGGDCVYYNGLPSFFYLTLGGNGETWMNSEMIH